VRSKAWVCGHSFDETAGSNPAGGMDVCLLWALYVVRERFASRSSLFQWSPADCGVPECDRETSIMRPWPTRGCRVMEKKSYAEHIISIQKNDFLFVSAADWQTTVCWPRQKSHHRQVAVCWTNEQSCQGQSAICWPNEMNCQEQAAVCKPNKESCQRSAAVCWLNEESF